MSQQRVSLQERKNQSRRVCIWCSLFTVRIDQARRLDMPFLMHLCFSALDCHRGLVETGDSFFVNSRDILFKRLQTNWRDMREGF